jgi:endogenous inhibitor of DNA gyrase (YacG/DUF329 family)
MVSKVKVKVKCPDCGKVVTGIVPKFGDGSAWYPYSHGNPITNQMCKGCFRLVDEPYEKESEAQE